MGLGREPSAPKVDLKGLKVEEMDMELKEMVAKQVESKKALNKTVVLNSAIQLLASGGTKVYDSENLTIRTEMETFDVDLFDAQMLKAENEIKMYEMLGKDFSSERRSAQREFDSLVKISSWHKEFNANRDLTPSEITEVKRLVRVKSYVDPYELMASNFEDYTVISGIYTPMELYLIPIGLVNNGNDFEGELDKKSVLDFMKDIARNVELSGKITLPSDAILGSMKLINRSTIACVKRSESHPYSKAIRTIKNWEFITEGGWGI